MTGRWSDDVVLFTGEAAPALTDHVPRQAGTSGRVGQMNIFWSKLSKEIRGEWQVMDTQWHAEWREPATRWLHVSH